MYHIEEAFNGDTATIPMAFDWADSYNTQGYNGKCAGAVRSQLNCGSCWAFSATSVFADRLCVQSKGTISGVVLSPQQLISCDTLYGCKGCDGGSSAGAWNYFQNNGVVNDACIPYPISASNATK